MNGQQNNAQVNDDRLVIPQNNTFINNNVQENNTELYSVNTPKAPVDYSQDPKVQENMQKKKTNTVTISSDGKVLILIAIILLLFIFFLPQIYGFLH